MKKTLIVLCFNFQILFVLAQSINSIEQFYDVCKNWLESLKAGNKLFTPEIFTLVSRIKEVLKESGMSQSQIDQFKELLILGENTHLFNKLYSNKCLCRLCSKSFSLIPEGSHNQAQFELTTKDKGQSFKIRNLKYNEYL